MAQQGLVYKQGNKGLAVHVELPEYILVGVYEWEGVIVLRESREVSLLLKPLHLAENQSKIMRVQEEALAHLLIQRQTHFTIAAGG